MKLLLGDRWDAVIALVVASTLSGFVEAAILAIVAQAASGIVSRSHAVAGNFGFVHVHVTLGTLLLIGIGLAIARFAFQAAISYLLARVSSEVQVSLRRRLFESFTRASWSVQSSDREGHFQELVTSQVGQASQGAIQASTLVTSLIAFVVLVLSALSLNFEAALVVLVVAIGLFAALRPLSKIGALRARDLSQAQLHFAGAVSESTRLAEETHVFGVGDAQIAAVSERLETARSLFFRTQYIGRSAPSIYQSAIYLILVAGLLLLYRTHATQVTSLGAVVLLLVRAGSYGNMMQASYQSVRQALPFIERIQDAEKRYATNRVKYGSAPLLTVEALAFEHVSFAYKERPALSDVSFAITRGEAIGIIGPSGAGKSTLAQIMLQLRQPVRGRYLVNGEPADTYSGADWHRLIAYVPQTPHLIHASAADNIRYFRDIPFEDVERAAELASIHEDILDWSNGYDTIVGPRADAVSGGQQQRLCLARALAARPDILILDEPTSALDPKSEELVQQALATLRRTFTIIIIAHRMSTLELCDRIMVVVDGQLEAFGPAETLSDLNSYYRSATLIDAGMHRTQLP